MSALSYEPLFKLDNTTKIYLFAILLYTSVLVSTNNCSVDLYNAIIKPRLFFTCYFTQGWLNSYYYSLSILSCLFIVIYKRFNERYWSRMCICCVCIVYILLAVAFIFFVFRFFAYLIFSHWCCCWFTYNNFFKGLKLFSCIHILAFLHTKISSIFR